MANLEDDEYVATLLKQEAKSAKKTYELVGLDAFNPKRSKSGAPKPNTNFLRHIIRQTDSHNAALLAREAEESNVRFRNMNRERARADKNAEKEKERKADGRLTPILSDGESRTKTSRERGGHSEGMYERNNRDRRRERSTESRYRRHRSRSKDTRREKRKRTDSEGEQSSRRSRHLEHHRREGRRHRHDSDEEGHRSRSRHKSDHGHRRHRPRSRSSHSSRSLSSHAERAERKRSRRSRSRSPNRTSHHHKPERTSPSTRKEPRKASRRSPNPASDSDPLEAIVGPLPPDVQPSVRSRGRGAHKANSMGMDSRFSSTYDPAIDVRQASDAEDEWGDTLEAFRDRQRWKQQGADRLKAAGFTDDQVRKWEKGDEKDEEDVTWTKRGQAREWDRGKVVDKDGDVELKAEWGRLK